MKNRILTLTLLITVLISLGSVIASGQDGPGNTEVLTNNGVVSLVKAGLPANVIVSKIRASKTNFNISTEELIRLQQARVPAEIINAMIEASGHVSATGAAPPAIGTSAAPGTRGVFVQVGPDWKRIEEVSSIEVRAVGGIASQMTLGLKESRVICVFRGDKAELQLSERRPVFRINGLGASTRDIYIVAMRLNPDRRDLEMGRSGLLKKVSFGFRKRDVRDVEVKRLGDDLLEATPKHDLEPGEYIMVLGGAGVRSNNAAGMEGTTGYDFGILRVQ